MNVDKILTSSVRYAQRTFQHGWRRWCELFGPPSESSALSCFHYVMTEYREPVPAASVKPYKIQRGPYKVGVKRTKGSDGRLPVCRTYPEEINGPLPVLVLSPGMGAHANANKYLEDHLASHGYLVVRPRHRGSDILACWLKTPLGTFTRAELRRRVGEMELVLQDVFNDRLPIAVQKDKIALGGHSFGALTSCILAGLPAPDVQVQQHYPISAVVALSPYGDSFPTRCLGINVMDFDRVSPPVLYMSGSRDELFTLGKGARAHLEPFHASSGEHDRHVVIGRTRHGSFSEIMGWVRTETRVMVNSSVVAFLDTHLLGHHDSNDYLQNRLSLAAFEFGSWAFQREPK